MPKWEEDEFELQQQAVKQWAEKKIKKISNGWWFRRKLAKLSWLVTIIYGQPMAVEIRFFVKDVDDNGKQVE